MRGEFHGVVVDHFARLGLPRQAWLDPEAVKEKFLTLSAAAHPDKSIAAQAEAAFRDLNESYQALRSPRARILHFLELNGAAKRSHAEAVPSIVLELFAPIATATKKADDLLREKASANSPMLKVQYFEKALGCVDTLQELQTEVQRRIQLVEDRVQHAGREDFRELEEAAAALGFLERWRAQLQERATALTF